MLDLFKKHLEDNFAELFQTQSLLAISGGIDSTVLAHLLHECGVNYAMAHCNFSLRGAASDCDAAFVRELASKLDKEVHSVTFNTEHYATEQKISIQMAARELRYTWFKQLMTEHGCSFLLTAHNLNDNAETVLINFTRGCSLQGLIGMQEADERIKRVLLPFTREQISKYAEQSNINWREDESNSDTKYFRNKIRHRVTPVLQELNPSYLQSFNKNNQYLRGQYRLYREMLEEKIKSICHEQNEMLYINIDLLTKEREAKTLLSEILLPYGFKDSIEDIYSSLEGLSGKQFFYEKFRITKDRKYLLLEKLIFEENSEYIIEKDATSFRTPSNSLALEWKAVSLPSSLKASQQNSVYLDVDKIKFPLTLRKWREGDRFQPFGMKGSKKVSKYLKDIKLSRPEKDRTWVLCCGEEIVWLIGHRIDARYALKDSPDKALLVRADWTE